MPVIGPKTHTKTKTQCSCEGNKGRTINVAFSPGGGMHARVKFEIEGGYMDIRGLFLFLLRPTPIPYPTQYIPILYRLIVVDRRPVGSWTIALFYLFLLQVTYTMLTYLSDCFVNVSRECTVFPIRIGLTRCGVKKTYGWIHRHRAYRFLSPLSWQTAVRNDFLSWLFSLSFSRYAGL